MEMLNSLSKINNLYLKQLDTKDQLWLLRVSGLILKLILTFFAAETFGLSLTSPVLYWGLGLESLYIIFTLKYREIVARLDSGLFAVLLLDTIFWITWLYCTGGATNAFISLLLLPIAIAAVTLPRRAAWSLTLLSTLAYSVMIFTVPEHHMKHHGMDMSSHYLGMWFNFVISSLVLTTSVAYITQRMRQQKKELSIMREAQLRQEKILALGTASAQMAHQLATPLSSLRLLVDEALEEAQVDSENEPQILIEMNNALLRCEGTLTSLRLATESIREHKQQWVKPEQLLEDLKQQVLLLMPQVKLDVQHMTNYNKDECSKVVLSDTSLLPALMSLIENASSASLAEIGENRVDVSATIIGSKNKLLITVKDYGSGVSQKLNAQIGHKLIKSEQGFGMALLLSHATFERLGGQLLLRGLPAGGTAADISLPLQENIEGSA